MRAIQFIDSIISFKMLHKNSFPSSKHSDHVQYHYEKQLPDWPPPPVFAS